MSRLFFPFLLLCCMLPRPVFGQGEGEDFSSGGESAAGADRRAEAELLFEKFKAAAGFDYLWPREKVYLHLDNSAYLEKDTLWYKAYVVRASSLLPTNLSKVLYVELLNADGQLLEQQILEIDSLGQADGCFKLGLPVRAGFHEIRAFTREMTNWGEEACFSRVFPVFSAQASSTSAVAGGAFGIDNLSIPQPESHRGVSFGCPRPYTLGEASDRLVQFFPEGGLRAKGLGQHIAFTLTDGRGHATPDTLQIFSLSGALIAETVSEHEGMGSFFLPADCTEGYAKVKGFRKKFALPEALGAYTLTVNRAEGEVSVEIAANDSAAAARPLLGLAVINRERMCFFDTLSVDRSGLELVLPAQALREGVNRLELFDASGVSLASRLVWKKPEELRNRRLEVRLKQNKAVYDPFEPAVLSVEITDKQGRPVEATFSVSVREESGNIVADSDGGIEADFLLASELRGYIHRPDLYFVKDDAAHRRMLDLLLLVQGWRANSFSTMCGRDSFNLRQPVEDKLILRGTLYKDNDKLQPQPDFRLSVFMYSLSGSVLKGFTTTDKEGKFAFEASINYEGDYIAQFSMVNENNKPKWSRLSLDRWFAPQPRAFEGRELDISLYTSASEAAEVSKRMPEIFEWRDTIPRTLPTILGEAKVTTQGKYRGFTGNRYTYNGGERTGMDRATKFYNIRQEVERYKDLGRETGTIWQFLTLLDGNLNTDAATDEVYLNDWSDMGFSESSTGDQSYADTNSTTFGEVEEESTELSATEASVPSTPISFNGKEVTLYINNDPDAFSRYPEFYQSLPAEEVKSVSVVEDGMGVDALSGKALNRSKARYSVYVYELPDSYRLKASKGKERRSVKGFSHKLRFYSPNYRSFDLPSQADVRRTLVWEPSLTTNADGVASLIFFTNARESQTLDVSLRGVTLQGGFVE